MAETNRPSVRHDILPLEGELFLPKEAPNEWRDYRISVIRDLDRLENHLDVIRERIAKLEVTLLTSGNQVALDRIIALRSAEEETDLKLVAIKLRVKANEDLLAQRKGALAVWSLIWGIIGAIITGVIIWFLTGNPG